MSYLLSRKQAPNSKGRIQKITPELAGWKYVGFEVFMLKSGESLDRCLCNHAEANAIMHCAILGIETGVKDAILYSTHVPCLECSKMAITIGVKKIMCLNSYSETDYNLMNDAGISVQILDKEKIQYWAKLLIDS